ncbi:MAG TPA: hypothetical protein H9680_02525 [Firmicutes bacterium]|nr:hypothetical protein [Bacillota bacterium]
MKRMIAVLLSAVMVLSLAACGGSQQSGGEGAAASSGSELLFGVPADASSLDPQTQNDGYSEEITKMLYNTLFKFDENATPVPSLVESYEVSDDDLTWTFKLKEGVKFHNGKELTSADVVASFNRAIPDDSGYIATSMIEPIESVEAVDTYTVAIKTFEPYGPMLSLLSNYNTAIMDADYVEQYGRDLGTSVETINGTGPYKITDWSKDEEIVLVKNDDYFDGAAQIGTIHYLVIPEASSRVIALENGEVDVIYSVSAEDIPRLEETEGLTVMAAAGVGQRLFRFGCNDPIMSNTLVRQALVYAVDREAIRTALFDGVSEASTGPLAPVIFGSYDYGAIEQDQDKARELLAQAGYPDGFDTKIVTTAHYAKGVELAEMLAAQFEEIGVHAEIEVMEMSVLLPLWSGVTAEEFDQPLFIMGAGTSMVDADGGYRGLYTTTPDGRNDRNYGFYSNEEVDRLVQAGMTETDPEQRKEYYRQAGQILYLDDPAGIWLYDQYNVIAYRDGIEGLRLDAQGSLWFDQATMA